MSNMLDNFLQELQTQDSTDAPFNLSADGQKNRMVFQKVRAKNFRSVGSEFMELDFIKNKTTLIVSEDNGSGKSTLCVWAPYFALTGKPYSRKEKIAALVNSQTRKDLLVELYLTTRGIDYKIVRGYKPAVFDIYKKEAGSWVKFEAPPSSAQQQSNLEMLLGFDAKILEKTMILGLDKFEPFIDLDASNRRQLIEKIWDLSIFSVMLDEAKKLAAIGRRKKDEISINIDKETVSLNTNKQDIVTAESFKEDLTVLENELRTLKEIRLVELQQSLVDSKPKFELSKKELIEENQTITEELETVTERIKQQHEAQGQEVKKLRDEAIAMGEQLESEAKATFESEHNTLLELLSTKKAECESETKELLNSLKSKLETLTNNVKESSSLADKKVTEYNTTHGQLDLSSTDKKIEELEEVIKSAQDRIDQTSTEIAEVQKHKETQEFFVTGGEIRLKEVGYDLKNNQSKLDEFEKSKQTLANTGNCPHCLQLVGEESLKLFEESIEESRNRINESNDFLNAEIQKIQKQIDEHKTAIEQDEQSINELKHIEKDLKESVTQTTNEIREHEHSKELATKEHESKIQAEQLRIRSEIMLETENALRHFKTSESVTQISELKSKHKDVLGGIESKISTLESKINSAVSEAKRQASEATSSATVAYNTWKERYESEVTSKTSNLTERLASNKKSLEDLELRNNEFIEHTNSRIELTEQSIKDKEGQCKVMESKIHKLVTVAESNITTLEVSLEGLETTHQEVSDKLVVQNYLIDELGDSAAKREIIKQYIPFLNAKINEYMAAMNMYVGFNMDEKFEVSFSSPDRKTQTVHSLSNGQKTRMNLAILFALRDVANLKNTTDSNLLVLDELLESLSEQGVREVVAMLRNKFSNYNIILITQRKTEFCEYFDNTICYGLRGGFTEEVTIQ